MILGIDIGATKTRVGFIERETLVKSKSIGTNKDPERFLRDLSDLIEEFLGGKIKELSGIGIGAPGPLDPSSGAFGELPNLPLWNGFSIKSRIENLYSVPAFLQNDANVATLGEALYGGGRGYKYVCYITISTGIGAGFVIDKRIVEGKNNLAGEIWALTVDNLGQSDILLNACSGPGIVRNSKRLIDNGEESSLSTLDRIETKDVFNHAFNGDKVSKKVIENAWENMAFAIEIILVTLDPDIVLLGGGLCFEEKYMVDPVRERVYKRVFLETHKNTPVKRSDLWNEAVIYGAIALAQQSNGKIA